MPLIPSNEHFDRQCTGGPPEDVVGIPFADLVMLVVGNCEPFGVTQSMVFARGLLEEKVGVS
jgi:hypothetical protein